MPLVGQEQCDLRDQMAAWLFLEAAVAIIETTFLAGEGSGFTGFCVEGRETFENVANFAPISPDVLDRGGADGAWDAGKILEAANTLEDAPAHQIVPGLSCSRGKAYPLADLLDTSPRHSRDSDYRLQPRREHGVAAAAEQVKGKAQLFGEPNCLGDPLHVLKQPPVASDRAKLEGVAVRKIEVGGEEIGCGCQG
ncbi:hypothetical protein GCM10011324_34720 [Allosediminivita pacifica]|nr:hypothetical protein GCM10011324_34720 [Allosediminivita pacifica]